MNGNYWTLNSEELVASIRETDDSKSAISIEKDCINIIQRNHSNVFIESFSLALQQCRIDNSEISFQNSFNY